MNTFNGIALLIYLACIIAVLIQVMVNIIRNFYQSMFGKTSYLTHTLPVTSQQLLLSKIIAGVLWGIVSGIVIFFTILLLAALISRYIPSFDDIGYLLSKLELFNLETILLLFNGTMEYIQGILLIFLAMTIVHTCYIRKYRVACGIGIYAVINYAVSFVLNLFQQVPGVSFLSFAITTNEFSYTNSVSTGDILIALAVNLILCCLYFFATKYFLDHKLEVE